MKLQVIDTHTGGEPTRVVVEGAPEEFGDLTISARVEYLRDQADWMRRSLICEPRGCDWMVGALVHSPCHANSTASVIFFNNVGYLGMCGHGLIGVVEALAHQGQIEAGLHRFDTPVGTVAACLHSDRSVSIENVTSYRYRKDVKVEVDGYGRVCGDVAYGGNWFFLSTDADLEQGIPVLLPFAQAIRASLINQGITGAEGAEIDHIELFGAPSDENFADGRCFVLCPGGQYDRSPCGTGTSAKLACLAEDGKLGPGEIWRQESIIGSIFEGSYKKATHGVCPTIKGRAFVTGELSVVFDDMDPFRYGI
ncbi:MAG: hydroxyproline-2-epimerase [Planctomycetaceae bacterium]|nr:hydroxyproline-2-epimerase [Planctomycetaceae bacterium]